MRHRVVSKDNRTGSKVLLLLRETNEAMETSSSRKRFALPPLSPLFSSISGFPGPCPPSPLPEQIHEFFHFLTIPNDESTRIEIFRSRGTNRAKENLFLLLDVSGDATKTSLSRGFVLSNLGAFERSSLVTRPGTYFDVPSSNLYSIHLWRTPCTFLSTREH